MNPMTTPTPRRITAEDDLQKKLDDFAAKVEENHKAFFPESQLTPPDLTKMVEEALDQVDQEYGYDWRSNDHIAAMRNHRTHYLLRHLQPLTAELARLKEENAAQQAAHERETKGLWDAVLLAINILDGNADQIDWRDGSQHELLRKLCEHLAAVDKSENQNEAQITALRADLERVTRERDGAKRNYYDVADAICRESTGPEDLCKQARAIRSQLTALQAKSQLDDELLRRMQEDYSSCMAILDAAGVPTNGPEGVGKRESLTLPQRVTALQAAHAEAKRDGERLAYVRKNFANAIHYCCRTDGDEWNTDFNGTLDKWIARDAARTQTKAPESRADGGEQS